MSKFTKGPWVAKYDRDENYGCGLVESPEGFDVAIITGSNYGVALGGPERSWRGEFDDEDEFEANAFLISAAPELYEALVWAMKFVEQVRVENPAPEGGGEDIAYEEALAALKKARGDH